ncbi:hypothetical protein [Planococcus faecalis]|uniref:Phage tail tape measure protein n=1 Tax=Planococcus faecalis TaxID=1598147 RepID=A0ABM6ITR5_9BACL|nr:hypothetical protein [Planococcus faecalis]AQU79715.1 hypothetical protein AJGP001_10765 [Planococcus faecalis]OHX55293.1 hypothetical protein BB777_04435 [Planococcus faecalis]
MNYENDAALGLSATETTRNSAANELYGKSFKDLSEAQKQLTLLQMVEDANKISGAMGMAAKESDGFENVVGNLSQSWTDLKAAMGEPVLEVAVQGMKWMTEQLQGIDGEKLAAGIMTAIASIAATFDTIRNNPAILWMQETLPVVFEAVKTAIQDALASEAVMAAVDGMTSKIESVKEVGQGLWDFFVSMGPGVMVIFQDLWTILQPIFNALGTAFSLIGDIVGTVFNTIVLPLLKLVWEAFQILWGIISPILKLLAVGIEVTFAYLELVWQEIIKPVLTYIGEKFTETYEVAKPALDGIKTYLGLVRDSFDTLMGRVDDFVSKIKGIEIPDWVTNGVSAVGDFFTPNYIDGSHATGLARVNKNGYIAELHSGEAVLTAGQSNTLRGMGVLKSSGEKPVLNTAALSRQGTGTGRTISKGQSKKASTFSFTGDININGANLTTKEMARELVDELKYVISAGGLA